LLYANKHKTIIILREEKMTKFEELGITQPILKALDEMGFKTPTEVQSRAIPHILNKEDMIVMSKTGSGKTAVFGVPLLQLSNPEASYPQCLILTPTRELAVQIDKKMSKYLPHKTTAVYGKHSMKAEVEAISRGVTIVTGTPGRVFDHISQKSLNIRNVRFLVLDEADRMLDMGFIDQVRKIVKSLPVDRVTLLFSATIPMEIRRICNSQMKNPVTIEIESPTMTVDTIKQCYFRVERNEKRTQLFRLLLSYTPESCLIFCNTRIAVDYVHNYLTKKGCACLPLHGDVPQGKRLQTLQQFKSGRFPILVATDVAARGLDINNLAMVINFDVPEDKDNYVHRIGRTGRAGKDGFAISLVTSNDIMSLYEIEEHIGVIIENMDLPTDSELNAGKEASDKWILSQSGIIKPAAPKRENKNKERGQSANKRSSDNRNYRNRHNTQNYPRNRTNATARNREYGAGIPKPTFTPQPQKSPPPKPAAQAPAEATIIKEQTSAESKSFIKKLISKLLKK